MPQSKAGKTFGLKEHLQRYLHLPPSKALVGLEPVISLIQDLSFYQAFGVAMHTSFFWLHERKEKKNKKAKEKQLRPNKGHSCSIS